MATAHKSLVLILMRDLASNVAMPFFVVDAEGTLVYYNGAAEQVLGLRWAEAGELKAGEWGSRWEPQDLEGNPIPADDLPLTIAFAQQRPAHGELTVQTPDGARRHIEATAFPLFGKADDFAGAVAIFWEKRAGS
jgi:PAS domain-containing protein